MSSVLAEIFTNVNLRKASLKNLNTSSKFGDIADKVQIRYSRNSDVAIALRQCFMRSWSYIEHAKSLQTLGSKKTIPLPDDLKEYLEIYTTEYDDCYILEPIVANELQEFREIIQQQHERQIEVDFDYNYVDPKAGLILNERMTKIRKLNRKIGENLKLLYG